MRLIVLRPSIISLLIGISLLQVGCTTQSGSSILRFHYYKMGTECEEITPQNVKIYTFRGIQLPFYPTNILRKPASFKAFPMVAMNEIKISDIFNNPYRTQTFICFDEYYPVELTTLFELLRLNDVNYRIGDTRNENKREICHILIPLLPRKEVSTSLTTERSYVSVFSQGRCFPFLYTDKCPSAEQLMLSRLGLNTLKTPDIIPLNHYYSAYKISALRAIDLAYPKSENHIKRHTQGAD